ncbi:MAG TPA: heme peroxidase family protein [Candidatus Eisenbacteria bacterium]|nr:heme peroxidase family protein [Candidatus Eisenbacteria bacterium]
MNTTENGNRFHALDRRGFLRTCGKAVLLLSVPSLDIAPSASAEQSRARRPVIAEDRFGRLFPSLPPFAEPSQQLREALLEIGNPDGLMDAGDALDQGPVELIVNPELSKNNPNNPNHTAGVTFFGQFIDHDMTFDLTSRLGRPVDPERSPNLRTPGFDLDSVYGAGPIADRELYQPSGRGRFQPGIKFKVENGGRFEDLPRSKDGAAVIADPRNDENLIIAGLHAAFLLFHNRLVDALLESRATFVAMGARPGNAPDVFHEARRLMTWHYQWIIVHEFLPLIVGQQLVNEILARGRRFYRPEVPFIPVEFQGAAYRFGHSMVRPSYRANLAGDADNQPFFGMVFDPSQENSNDPDDMRGGFRASRRFIGWQTFFDFGDKEVRPNKRIDTKISTPLFDLPIAAIPGAETSPTSLPQRNLLRHVTWQLPSGQSIANVMKAPVLAREDLGELSAFGLKLDESTPLWYYVLKEAEIMEDGLRLGPVGGRIVAEVIIGLLQLDRDSYLSADPRWRPTLPARNGKVTRDFRMVDFLTFAGVDPKTRGQ